MEERTFSKCSRSALELCPFPMGIHWKVHGTIEVFDFDNITTLIKIGLTAKWFIVQIGSFAHLVFGKVAFNKSATYPCSNPGAFLVKNIPIELK
jgi:hypothetical protein